MRIALCSYSQKEKETAGKRESNESGEEEKYE